MTAFPERVPFGYGTDESNSLGSQLRGWHIDNFCRCESRDDRKESVHRSNGESPKFREELRLKLLAGGYVTVRLVVGGHDGPPFPLYDSSRANCSGQLPGRAESVVR